jgi:hypothetical protein
MPTHCLACIGGLPRNHRIPDGAMFFDVVASPCARDIQRLHALCQRAPKLLPQALDNHGNGGIAAGPRDQHMEVLVCLWVGSFGTHGALKTVECLGNLHPLCRRCVPRRECCRLRFDNPPRLQKIEWRNSNRKRRRRQAATGGGALPYPGTRADLDFQYALQLERAQGFAQGTARNPERRGELALGGQTGAGPK